MIFKICHFLFILLDSDNSYLRLAKL